MLLIRRDTSVLMLMLGLILLLGCGASAARAQEKSGSVATLAGAAVEENTNLDIELYLLVASDAAPEGGKLPAHLEPVVKRLRASLPFANYRLSATMINRVQNGGNLNVKGVGGTPFPKGLAPAPIFSEYSASGAKLKNDATGRAIVELTGFRFGARVPVQTSTVTQGSGGSATVPVIQYENTGIYTAFSMREGEPVVVGTLNVGQTGEVFILVVSAKRTEAR